MVAVMRSGQIVAGVLDGVIKIMIVVIAVMFTYKYALEAFDFGYRVFAEGSVSPEESARVISISITEDATPMEIGEVLEEKGLIRDARLFYVQEFFSGQHGKLKEGIYELSSAMTAEEMIDVMCTGTEEPEARRE